MGRVTRDYRSSSKKAYYDFCLQYPRIDLSFKEWKKIIYTYNQNYRERILLTGEKVRMPYGFGEFSIHKTKPKIIVVNHKEINTMRIDWKKTKQVGKRVYHLNRETGGYKFRWLWFKHRCLLYVPEVWNFHPTRESSKKITEYLLKPGADMGSIYRNWRE